MSLTKFQGRTEDTLRPVTIKQIIDATQAHPDAEFKLDNSGLAQVSKKFDFYSPKINVHQAC